MDERRRVVPIQEYRTAHLRHHSEQVDLIGMDLSQTLAGQSNFARSAILIMEACYIPVIFMIVRMDALIEGFRSKSGCRARVFLSVGTNGLIYLTLAAVSPRSLILYLCTIILKIHCIRLADAFQHTYDRVAANERMASRGWRYEQQNTFSFPVLKRHRIFNLLLLNFGFHNAHHAAPNCPWYHLPKIDRALRQYWPATDPLHAKAPLLDEIGFGSLLRAYHKNRIRRIIGSNAGAVVQSEDSFLTAALLGTFTDHLLG